MISTDPDDLRIKNNKDRFYLIGTTNTDSIDCFRWCAFSYTNIKWKPNSRAILRTHTHLRRSTLPNRSFPEQQTVTPIQEISIKISNFINVYKSAIELSFAQNPYSYFFNQSMIKSTFFDVVEEHLLNSCFDFDFILNSNNRKHVELGLNLIFSRMHFEII